MKNRSNDTEKILGLVHFHKCYSLDNDLSENVQKDGVYELVFELERENCPDQIPKIFKIAAIFTIKAQINKFKLKFWYNIDRIKYSAILINPENEKIHNLVVFCIKKTAWSLTLPPTSEEAQFTCL